MFLVVVVTLLAGGTVYVVLLQKKSVPKQEIPTVISEKKIPRAAESERTEPKKEEVQKIFKSKSEPKMVVKPAPSQAQNFITQTKQSRDPWQDPIPPVPENLALPFDHKDIQVAERLLSPYGVIRHSRDSGIGHGGIDFPLKYNSPIYAVADGIILKSNFEEGEYGAGNTIDLLILPKLFEGEGWIFKYDHVILDPGLKVISQVRIGQKIGMSNIMERGNNHIGLEYNIRNFTIAREKICWVDRLEPAARYQLENAFDGIKKTTAFMQSWQTANEEGYFPYKALLDDVKYPNGPQLCYPLGTDVRIPTK